MLLYMCCLFDPQTNEGSYPCFPCTDDESGTGLNNLPTVTKGVNVRDRMTPEWGLLSTLQDILYLNSGHSS